MKRCGFLLAFLAAGAAAGADGASPAFVIEGRVIHVEDGDTLTVLGRDLSKTSIRMTDIDAPETSHGRSRPGQPFSKKSKLSLANLALGRQASADCYEKDRHGRPVCRVFVDGIDLNAEQLRRGMAWANGSNVRYVRDAGSYELEQAARASATGLWGDPRPVSPWEWRKTCWKGGECDGAGE